MERKEKLIKDYLKTEARRKRLMKKLKDKGISRALISYHKKKLSTNATDKNTI